MGAYFGSETSKALTFWQWCNHLVSECPAGKTVVWVNMDETSVALYNGLRKGNVFFWRHSHDVASEPAQRINRSLLRTNLTMISFCCSEPLLQPHMPHIIIGNENTFKASEFLALLEVSPTNVYLIRQKSAWNNKHVMLRLVALLNLILQRFSNDYYFILGLDAAGCHIVPEVLLAFRASFLKFLLVPAKLTFMLQVLDTHGFRRWKNAFGREYQKKRSASETGQLSISDFLTVIYKSINLIFPTTKWKKAFLEDGWSHSQSGVCKYITDWCRIETMPHISNDMPSTEALQLLFPGGNRTYRYDLCRPVRAPILALPPPPLPQPVLALSAPPSVAPVEAHGTPLIPRRRLPATFASIASSSAAPPPTAP